MSLDKSVVFKDRGRVVSLIKLCRTLHYKQCVGRNIFLNIENRISVHIF